MLIFQLASNHSRLIEGNSTMKTLLMEEAQLWCTVCRSSESGTISEMSARNVTVQNAAEPKLRRLPLSSVRTATTKLLWSKSQCCIQGPVDLTADTVRLARQKS